MLEVSERIQEIPASFEKTRIICPLPSSQIFVEMKEIFFLGLLSTLGSSALAQIHDFGPFLSESLKADIQTRNIEDYPIKVFLIDSLQSYADDLKKNLELELVDTPDNWTYILKNLESGKDEVNISWERASRLSTYTFHIRNGKLEILSSSHELISLPKRRD